MELLKNRIINDGTAIRFDNETKHETEIVKADSFLNHQLDVGLFKALAKEFYCRFGDLGINKILTIESSAIAIATMTSMYFDLAPVVFAKKMPPTDLGDEYYSAEIKSTAKDKVCTTTIAKKFLSADDKVLIVDVFLAHGNSTKALIDLVEQAGGTVCGVAAVIEKEFQGGSKMLRDLGYNVSSLAVIDHIESGQISFKD